MNNIDVTPLFALQSGLDNEIHKLHHESYGSTLHKRILALFVELGEFANETRCFKFWSEKGPSPKAVILDEYADALHFFLSLGLAIGVKEMKADFTPRYTNIVEQLEAVYVDVASFSEHLDESHYKTAFGDFLNLLPLLNYSEDDLISAYKKKLAVNYARQENHY